PQGRGKQGWRTREGVTDREYRRGQAHHEHEDPEKRSHCRASPEPTPRIAETLPRFASGCARYGLDLARGKRGWRRVEVQCAAHDLPHAGSDFGILVGSRGEDAGADRDRLFFAVNAPMVFEGDVRELRRELVDASHMPPQHVASTGTHVVILHAGKTDHGAGNAPYIGRQFAVT